jgi:hypothetical protein
MPICTPLIAYPQPAPLRQPGQGPFHHPAMDAQATAMIYPAFGQHGGDAECSQRLPMGRRIIGPVPLDAVRPTSGAPTLAPHGRNSLQQGQQLGHVVPMCPCHQRRPWNPPGVSEHMMLTAALPAIGGIRTGFSPHRRRPGGSDCQPRRGTSGANRVSAASRSCRSHSPSPGGAFPREYRTSGQREFLLAPPGSVFAAYPPSAQAPQGVTAEQAAPRAHWVPVVLPCTHNTPK